MRNYQILPLCTLLVACGDPGGGSSTTSAGSTSTSAGTSTTADATTQSPTTSGTSTAGSASASASETSATTEPGTTTATDTTTAPGTTEPGTSTTDATSTGDSSTGASSSSSSGGELCVGEAGSCAQGQTCCDKLECCAGVPVPVGQEFCSEMCPKSDRNLKTAFAAIDPAQVLAKVVALPITSWQYRKDGPEVRHLGPMAQDFHAAFGLWNSDTMIFPLDASGVSLAAIQALHARLQAAEAENEDLRARLERLERRLDATP